MKYLKSVELKNGKFLAKFQNGERTTQKLCADFFMMMQDKGAAPDELAGYIKLCKMMEPFHPWDEIERIANSFQKQAA
jgi:hypothetical protein